WTGPGHLPRWARARSTPRSSTRRSAPRSSTRKTWSECARRCLPWSSRQSVPEQEASLRPDLLPRLGAFARLLHDAGMEAGPRRLTDATRALTYIDLKHEPDFRSALRAVFVSRKDDLPTFEAAFDIFWAPPDPRITAGAIPGRNRPLRMSPERAAAWSAALGLNTSQLGREQEERSFTASSSGYTAEELLRQKDFDEMTWEE